MHETSTSNEQTLREETARNIMLPFVLDVGILQVDVTGWENPLWAEEKQFIEKLLKCSESYASAFNCMWKWSIQSIQASECLWVKTRRKEEGGSRKRDKNEKLWDLEDKKYEYCICVPCLMLINCKLLPCDFGRSKQKLCLSITTTHTFLPTWRIYHIFFCTKALKGLLFTSMAVSSFQTAYKCRTMLINTITLDQIIISERHC